MLARVARSADIRTFRDESLLFRNLLYRPTGNLFFPGHLGKFMCPGSVKLARHCRGINCGDDINAPLLPNKDAGTRPRKVGDAPGCFECLSAAGRCVETFSQIVLDDCACNPSLSNTVAVSLFCEPLKIDASAFEDKSLVAAFGV